MKAFVTRRLKAILIIIVLVFASLFVAFWFRSVLEKTPTPRIIVVDTLRWNMTKPQETVTIDEYVESCYEDDTASVWVSSVIIICTYHVYAWRPLYLGFVINGSANANFGYIQSMDINFSRTDNESYMLLHSDLYAGVNLNVWRFDSAATSTDEPYIKAKAVGHPNFTSLRIVSDWFFFRE